MKILAPFAIICVVLLAVVVWQLRPGDDALGGTSRPGTAPLPHSSAPLPTAAPVAEEPDEDELEALIEAPEEAAAVKETALGEETESIPEIISTEVKWVDEAGDARQDKRRFNELRAVLADDPDNESAWGAAMDIARLREWHNEIRDLLALRLLQRPDDLDLRYEYAVQLMRLKRWLDAYPHLHEVAQARPEEAQVQYNLAITCHALARLSQARAAWDRVIELSPENPDAYTHRGETLLDLREWRAAASDFEHVLETKPDDLGAALNLSLAYVKLGEPDIARDLLIPLLSDHPRHVPLLNRLADTSWQMHLAAPGGRADLAAETARYCERSLALIAAQPEISSLREEALSVLE